MKAKRVTETRIRVATADGWDSSSLRRQLDAVAAGYSVAALVAEPRDDRMMFTTALVLDVLRTALDERPASPSALLAGLCHVLYCGLQIEIAGADGNVAGELAAARIRALPRLQRLAKAVSAGAAR